MSSADAGPVGAAVAVADLFSVDPVGLGGVHLRARAGPPREAWLSALRARLPDTVTVRKLPVGATDDRLIGGLDLAATLSAGRPVLQRGLLPSLDGGVALVAMAERLEPRTVAILAAALDHGEVRVERDGFTRCEPARFGIVALDEGASDEEGLAPALADRLAFSLDLDGLRGNLAPADCVAITAAQRLLPAVHLDPSWTDALVALSASLGIASLRAPILALRAARVAAALAGRDDVAEEDVALAAALVLASRATRRPEPAEPETQDDGEASQDEPPDGAPQDAGGDTQAASPPSDAVVEAVRAALPPGLLDGSSGPASRAPAAARGHGAAQASRRRGRPIGTRAGRLVPGARLSVIDTVKAAVPWQAVRGEPDPGRLRIRTQDFRIRRYKDRRETVTIFAVDASGSVTSGRLAEAKGAVELLLADSYATRAHVALIAFRGTAAELLLPPTRSLARAKRELAGLPGGGGTPLAAGLDAARRVAADALRRGQTPRVVLLSDGRPNIARDGTTQRARARQEAHAAARALAELGCDLLVIDTSRRAGPDARALADAARARCVWLPHVEARAIRDAARLAEA
ncbi:magnesium chelatase subunit D [Acuticoccus sp.]|uniref:magnesium chelatase subunit D n=1 Tax=Acuticoccus sp. TaxID=1904378 RepID=UPI003B519D1C